MKRYFSIFPMIHLQKANYWFNGNLKNCEYKYSRPPNGHILIGSNRKIERYCVAMVVNLNRLIISPCSFSKVVGWDLHSLSGQVEPENYANSTADLYKLFFIINLVGW